MFSTVPELSASWISVKIFNVVATKYTCSFHVAICLQPDPSFVIDGEMKDMCAHLALRPHHFDCGEPLGGTTEKSAKLSKTHTKGYEKTYNHRRTIAMQTPNPFADL
jgi:hypothetical protein